MPTGADKERREFFRICDRMGIKLQVFDEAQRAQVVEQYEQDRTRLGLNNYLSLEREYALPRFKQVEAKYPEVADYLKRLEDRVETIARVVGLQEAEAGLETPNQKVEIGGGGMRLGTEEALEVGAQVYLVMALFPHRTHVVALGEVVASGGDAEDDLGRPHFASITFTRIEEEDREVIFKHVQDLQFRSLRDRPEPD